VASATESSGAGTRDRSTSELIHQVTELVPRLVREELALAKAELAEKGKRAGFGAGLFGGGGLMALFGLGVLIAAAVLGLAEAVPAWAAALIVAAVLLLVAGVLAAIARSQLRRAVPPLPEQAIESTREDVRTVAESARR
jgi:MFS family permease